MNVSGVVFHTKHNELTTFNLKGAMKKIILTVKKSTKEAIINRYETKTTTDGKE